MDNVLGYIWLFVGLLVFSNQLITAHLTKKNGKYSRVDYLLSDIKKYSDLAVACVANNPSITKSESKDAAVHQVFKSLKFAGVEKYVAESTVRNAVEAAYQNYKLAGKDVHVNNTDVIPQAEVQEALSQEEEPAEVSTKPTADKPEIDPAMLKSVADYIKAQEAKNTQGAGK